MTKNNIKDIIDFELRQIKLTDQIKTMLGTMLLFANLIMCGEALQPPL